MRCACAQARSGVPVENCAYIYATVLYVTRIRYVFDLIWLSEYVMITL